ncbi:MAG: hypothetical protein Q8R18_03465 [bacterium]|nr:hypothetical protein [bacterium]
MAKTKKYGAAMIDLKQLFSFENPNQERYASLHAGSYTPFLETSYGNTQWSLMRLFRIYRKLKQGETEAYKVLEDFVSENHSSQFPTYQRWSSTPRKLACPALTTMLGEQFCYLEDQELTRQRKDIALFSGAAARISDDLTDSRLVEPAEVYLLDAKQRDNVTEEQSLFYLFNERLEELVSPFDFKNRFRNLIKKYNEAQQRGRDLQNPLSTQEVVTIKDQTGGYPFLLLHALMFPHQEDPSLNFSPNYNPNNGTVKTKSEALFNLGALVSRLDDIYDEKLDRKTGHKSLATEGVTSWKTIEKEIVYVDGGLRQFYPDDRVEKTMDDYKAQISRLAVLVNNWLL